jgi:hypothetical protein
VERLVNWRSRVLQLPYGDQALFLHVDLFTMEDYELVCRARVNGRIALAPKLVRTLARSWWAKGLARPTLVNHAMLPGITWT